MKSFTMTEDVWEAWESKEIVAEELFKLNAIIHKITTEDKCIVISRVVPFDLDWQAYANF